MLMSLWPLNPYRPATSITGTPASISSTVRYLLGHAQLPQHERERQASSGVHVSSIKRDSPGGTAITLEAGQSWIAASMVRRGDWFTFSDLASRPIGDRASTILLAHCRAASRQSE